MRQSWLLVAVLSIITTAAGCSSMSKGKAKELLQKRFDADGAVYCNVLGGVSEKNGAQSGLENACVAQLTSAGFATPAGCSDARRDGTCAPMSLAFKPGKASVKGGAVKVPCGTKTLGEVQSVTTEGKSATVRYTRTFKFDSTKSTLSACEFVPLSEGEGEGKAVFKQDDSGDWIEQ
jgi:hypothetical protein